ncbi:MAG: hypothetical protein H8D96_00460 [Desulfobacterales bacterium]|uniref:Uncharacterized protein n=1 Tax=Candidatus Desulfatibia vada TaxID=2841696 RepID=A0A8J6NXM5_9BACT|nr:hypothetical protein [Candidatus Desulfatibia vada]
MIRKPQLSKDEVILEQRKERILSHLKKCRNRYSSVYNLIEDSPEDAIILFEHLLLDLLNAALLISKNREVTDLVNAEREIRKAQDYNLKNNYIEILTFYQKWQTSPERKLPGRMINNLHHSINRFFRALEHSYYTLKEKELNTKLDEYRERLKHQLIVFFLIILFVGVSSIFGVHIFRSYNRTRMNPLVKQHMLEIAEIAYKAKEANKTALIDITGSTCSDCACRDLLDLRGIDDSHPCAKKWYSAIKSIWNEITEESGPPDRFLRDAWDSPYQLDENENEFDNSPWRNDILLSAGQDGKRGTADDIEVQIKNVFY